MNNALRIVKTTIVSCLVILATYWFLYKDTYVRKEFPTMCNEKTCWDEAYKVEKNILSLITAAFVAVACLVCGHKLIAALLSIPCNVILTDAWERNYSHVYTFTVLDKILLIFAIIVFIYKIYPNISDSSKEARA